MRIEELRARFGKEKKVVVVAQEVEPRHSVRAGWVRIPGWIAMAFMFENACQSLLGGGQAFSTEYFIERSKLLLVLSCFVSFQKQGDYTCKLI